METKLACYPATHPAVIALKALAQAMRNQAGLLEALADEAERAGVPPFSAEFDEAAKLAGMPYSRAWDAYVDRDAWALAESRPLVHQL